MPHGITDSNGDRREHNCTISSQLCAHFKHSIQTTSGNIIEFNRFKRRQVKTSLQQRLGYYKCHRLAMVISNGDNSIKVVTNEKGEAVGDVLTIIC